MASFLQEFYEDLKNKVKKSSFSEKQRFENFYSSFYSNGENESSETRQVTNVTKRFGRASTLPWQQRLRYKIS